MTVLEALLSGLPVVVRYDTSFSDTVFHGENGYFAQSDEEMDGYLLELAADEEKRKAFGKRSLEISKTFSLEMFGRLTVAFYEKVFKDYDFLCFGRTSLYVCSCFASWRLGE